MPASGESRARTNALRSSGFGNKAAKLRAIREALRTAKRVWLATDCDREGQLIGQEILEHYQYRGQVMRVLFTAQDSQTIRDAFGRAKPNAEYARLYAAAVARRQADQIYNLSLTRTATVILGQGARRVIGVGRVKTPTLAIVCKRELEIRNFVPIAYFEVVATAKAAGGRFQMRHAPHDQVVWREIAQQIADAARDFEGALTLRVDDKRQGPPSCTICGRCRNYAAPASAGQPARRSRWRRSSMTARARRSSPILAPGAVPAAGPDIGRAEDLGRSAGGPVVQRHPRARSAGDPKGRERQLASRKTVSNTAASRKRTPAKTTAAKSPASASKSGRGGKAGRAGNTTSRATKTASSADSPCASTLPLKEPAASSGPSSPDSCASSSPCSASFLVLRLTGSLPWVFAARAPGSCSTAYCSRSWWRAGRGLGGGAVRTFLKRHRRSGRTGPAASAAVGAKLDQRSKAHALWLGREAVARLSVINDERPIETHVCLWTNLFSGSGWA